MNSADIRKENKRHIYKIMLDRQYHTKQQISTLTGLSVATCNTLLNDMWAENILLISDEKELRGLGRGSVRFKLNEEHEHYILLNIYACRIGHVADCKLVDAAGRIIKERQICSDCLERKGILQTIQGFANTVKNVNQMIVSVPGVIDEGKVLFCDIKELEGMNLLEFFRKETQCTVSIFNDMHLNAYGYQSEQKEEDAVVTMAGFHSHLLPGTVTMHKGQVISGNNGIAGLAGFMPFSVAPDQLPELMGEGKCFDVIAKIIGAIIAFLNPREIVLEGDLLNEKILKDLYVYCRKSVPEKYMPKLKVVSDFEKYLFQGMREIAIANKSF